MTEWADSQAKRVSRIRYQVISKRESLFEQIVLSDVFRKIVLTNRTSICRLSFRLFTTLQVTLVANQVEQPVHEFLGFINIHQLDDHLRIIQNPPRTSRIQSQMLSCYHPKLRSVPFSKVQKEINKKEKIQKFLTNSDRYPTI